MLTLTENLTASRSTVWCIIPEDLRSKDAVFGFRPRHDCDIHANCFADQYELPLTDDDPCKALAAYTMGALSAGQRATKPSFPAAMMASVHA